MANVGCGAALGAAALLIPALVFSTATAFLGRDAPASQSAPEQLEGIPELLLEAYARAPAQLERHSPQCTGMSWAILAGLGRIESTHLAGHDIKPDGDVVPRFLGPVLDGSGAGGNITPVHDTDNGRWDGNTTYDRALGPTQQLPGQWDTYGRDGNHDGKADPHNVFDNVLAGAVELCESAGGAPVDFTDRGQLRDALWRYNHSEIYVDDVLTRIEHYRQLSSPVGGEAGSYAGQHAVKWALRQVGKPYIWGGTGPQGYDCSGLTMKAWAAAGVTIPRVTTDQYHAGTRVSLNQLAPGDLLFYDTTNVGAPGPAPSHVTMYIGDGKMINAPGTGHPIRTQPLHSDFYTPRFMGAVRPHAA
ncbi:C40 family peptidase [Salinactinospora qingdaonensis]|uniref:NlpC/P60 domain-containing protein n=1 Tax=Salinactinospora qingdaonensis TaxID=702744 RepID=A0ABP7FRV4_9ACTN